MTSRAQIAGNGPIAPMTINYANQVGVGNWATVQAALTDSCAKNGGFGQVYIGQGATPGDGPTLGGETSYTINGCANVTILDGRGTTGNSCYHYSNSTTYVQGNCVATGSVPVSGVTSATAGTGISVNGGAGPVTGAVTFVNTAPLTATGLQSMLAASPFGLTGTGAALIDSSTPGTPKPSDLKISADGTDTIVAVDSSVITLNGGVSLVGGGLSMNGATIDMSGAKITTIGDGTASDDAAAFGQIPTSLPTTNALTMNNSGSGAASGTTFNGGTARTLSYNTLGAAGLGAANVFDPTKAQSAGTVACVSDEEITGLSTSSLQCVATGGDAYLRAHGASSGSVAGLHLQGFDNGFGGTSWGVDLSTALGVFSMPITTPSINTANTQYVNTTSGSIKIAPPTGALGTQTLMLPDVTGTLCTTGTCLTTLVGAVLTAPSGNQTATQPATTSLQVAGFGLKNNVELNSPQTALYFVNTDSLGLPANGAFPENLGNMLAIPSANWTINSIGGASLTDMFTCNNLECSHNSTYPFQVGSWPLAFPLGVTTTSLVELQPGFNDLSNMISASGPTSPQLDDYRGGLLAWALQYGIPDSQKLTASANCTTTGTWTAATTVGTTGNFPSGALKTSTPGATMTCTGFNATDAGIIGYRSTTSTTATYTVTVTNAGTTYNVTDPYTVSSTLNQTLHYTSSYSATANLYAIGQASMAGGYTTITITAANNSSDPVIVVAPYFLSASNNLTNSPAVQVMLVSRQCSNGTCSGATHTDAQTNQVRLAQSSVVNELRGNGINITSFDPNATPNGFNSSDPTQVAKVSTFTVTAGGTGYTSVPTVVFSGCTIQPQGTVTISGGSVVTGTFIVNDGGACFGGTPSVVLTGGGGSGATATTSLLALDGTHSNDIGGQNIANIAFRLFNSSSSSSDHILTSTSSTGALGAVQSASTNGGFADSGCAATAGSMTCTNPIASSGGIGGLATLGPNLLSNGAIGDAIGTSLTNGNFGSISFVNSASGSTSNELWAGIINGSTNPTGICVNGAGNIGLGYTANATCPTGSYTVTTPALNVVGNGAIGGSAILGNSFADYTVVTGASGSTALTATGSDTNIEMYFIPKGLGQMRFGSGGWTYASVFGGAGSAVFNNGGTATPAVKFYYGNALNISMDSNVGGLTGCGSGQQLRFVKNDDETGGALLGGFDLSGDFCTLGRMNPTSISINGGTAITGQSGTGGTVAMTASPTLTTPTLGVASATSIALTALGSSTAPLCTTTGGLVTNSGCVGTTSLPLSGITGGTAPTSNTYVFGADSVTGSNFTLTTPALGTPSALVLTNATGLPAAGVVAGALANGMTGTTQSPGDNSNKLDTTAYVDSAIGATAGHSDYWNVQSALFSTSTLLGAVYLENQSNRNTSYTLVARLSGTISCTVAPVVQIMDMGTSVSSVYAGSTTVSSLTTGTADATYIASSAVTTIPGHFYGLGFSSGTCITAPTMDITWELN